MKYFLIIFLIINPITFIAETNERQEKAGQLFRNQDYRPAIEQYMYLINELEVDNAEIYLNLAHAYFNMHNADKSAMYYDKIINHSNLYYRSIALNQLGYLADIDQNLNLALDYFKKSLKADPDNETARYNYELIKKRLLIQNAILQAQQIADLKNQGDSLVSDENSNKKQKTKVLQASKLGKDKIEEASEKGKDSENEKKPANLQPEKLEEIKLNKEKAEAILNALKNQEIKYIQQKNRKNTNPNQILPNRPDW